MIKWFIILGLLLINLQAGWLEDYQQGMYPKKIDKIYSLVQKDIKDSKYLEIAFRDAIADISNQLYSQVRSEQFLNEKIINDEYSKTFKKKIYVVPNLPIHGTIKEREKTENGKYYLLLSIDKKSLAITYKKKANDLTKDLNKIYENYLQTKDSASKEKILNLLSKKLDSYEKYSFVAKILNQKGILKPKIKPHFVEKELRELFNVTANDIKNLSKTLSKRIIKSNINGSIKIFPFSYEDKDTFSKFSYELKNHLKNSLSSDLKITSSADATYKLTGNYFINDKTLTVKTSLYDNNGEIIISSVNKMNIDKLTSKYYYPKKNEYKKMDALVLDPNLDVQVMMNGSAKNLLFKKGESVKIEVKVSKESYIYMIGNMRTRDNEQIQYLIPLSEDISRNKYMKHILYHKSNIWVEIGEFDIVPPFGVEVLHVFATNMNIVDRLPLIEEVEIDGSAYDMIVNDEKMVLTAENSISAVRGLPKKNKKKSLEQSEAIIKFTTIKN